MPTQLLGLTRDELRSLAEQWGLPAYRGSQLYHALYAERRFDFAQITNLPRALRERLERDAVVGLPRIEKRFASSDGTVRYLLRLDDARTVETVWMPEADRQTLCLSTQAGCAVMCRFCATGRLGLLRNLSAAEIIGQVLLALEDNREHLRPATNIVLMGQGEPLLNYDATLRALRLMADTEGMNIPWRRITLSTSGIIPGIRRLAAELERPKLAISLNATSEDERRRLMPVTRKYHLAELMEVCRRYPLRPWERLTFEYVLLGGVNDSPQDAARLIALLAGLRAKVNLIPWNPAPALPFSAPDGERVESFQNSLRNSGLLAFIRKPRGQDIFAACGQLASLETPFIPPASLSGAAPGSAS
ncbi:MAG: 23S rRNA (adenine(2503)-C(2))-methyltransferase RlmN [Candidatus Acidiferrales bacterium]